MLNWNKYSLILLLILVSLPLISSAQVLTHGELEKMKNYHIAHRGPEQNYEEVRKSSNTYGMVFTGLFLFYKKYMSSQDHGNCPFHISCSEYFIQSVHQKGIFIGVLNGMDRYTRCNGFNTDIYDINHQTHRFVDPVIWED